MTETGTEVLFFYTLLFATCHPPSQVDECFFGEVAKSPDKYSQLYSKFLLVGDFNADESEPVLAPSVHDYNAVNIIHESTCYKSINNPSYMNFLHSVMWLSLACSDCLEDIFQKNGT